VYQAINPSFYSPIFASPVHAHTHTHTENILGEERQKGDVGRPGGDEGGRTQLTVERHGQAVLQAIMRPDALIPSGSASR
jgi:hypothetical protein